MQARPPSAFDAHLQVRAHEPALDVDDPFVAAVVFGVLTLSAAAGSACVLGSGERNATAHYRMAAAVCGGCAAAGFDSLSDLSGPGAEPMVSGACHRCCCGLVDVRACREAPTSGLTIVLP